MARGTEDWVREVTTLLAEAYRFRGGADAAKPASPTAKDLYWATDTKILYVSVADGAWTGFDASIIVQGVIKLYENMNANSKKITNLTDPTSAQDAATKAYADTKLANVIEDTTPQLGGELDAQSNKIVDLAAPVADNDAVRKVYVDDTLNDVSQTDETASRVFDTVYENTSGKIRHINVVASASGTWAFRVNVGSTNPPTVRVGFFQINQTAPSLGTLSFIVPPSYFYKVFDAGGSPTLQNWIEWDLH